MEGGGEAVEAIGSSIDEPAGGGQVVGGEGSAQGGFLVAEKAGPELGGDGRVGGEAGIGDEGLIDFGGELGIVGAAGELDEAAAAKTGAVGWALVAEIVAVVVEVEGAASG